MVFNVNNLLSIFLLWNSFYQGIAWNYQDLKAWGDIAPICNIGKSQSPIDLKADVLGQNSANQALQFINYNALPQAMTLYNNGHTIELNGTWQSDNIPSITGTVLSHEVYTFAQAHLHWGTQDSEGTEHSFNSQKFASELHLVLINSKYQNLSEALNQPDGLSVIGVLFQVDDNFTPNSGMEIFSTQIQNVLNVQSTSNETAFDLSLFLPKSIKSFYSYSGSLTTPNCTENVRWIVLGDLEPITSEIISRLRKVALEDNDTHNTRPLQQINKRLVEFYEQK